MTRQNKRWSDNSAACGGLGEGSASTFASRWWRYVPLSLADLARASEYRSRAANFTREASAQTDPKIRNGLLSVAASYQRLAEIIERTADADKARET